MNTNQVIIKHKKKFDKTRIMVRILLLIIFAAIVAIQWKNITQLVNWISERM